MTATTLDTILARSFRAHGLVESVPSISAATVAAAGIYGSAPTAQLALAARIDGYEPAMSARAMQEDRSLLRVPGPRGSVFLAPRELVPDFLGLARPEAFQSVRVKAGIGDEAMALLGERIEAIVADAPLPAGGIRAALGEDAPTGQLLTLVLRELLHLGRLVAARPVGSERSNQYEYARMADWAPLPRPVPGVDEALATMAPLWMRANGPGTIDDLAWWAGVTKQQAGAALERLGADPLDVADLDGEQLASADVVGELATSESVDGRLHLLPMWDAWLMARRDRARILEERYRPYVVDRSGNVTNTIVLDGRVVGTWDVDGEELLLATFKPFDTGRLAAVAERLRPSLSWTSVRRVAPEPLDAAGQNRFRGPLRAV